MDWPKFAKRLLLADGTITEQEADLIRTAGLADGKVDKQEVEFLAELKRDAESVHPRFDEFFFSVMKRVVLVDGVIDDSEVVWLRRLITNDNQILPGEVRFIKELRFDVLGKPNQFGEDLRRPRLSSCSLSSCVAS